MTPAHLLRSRSGASAAEFALVLPLLVLLIFGIIDAGRFLWELNRAEKATQAGVRVAVVTDVLPTDWDTYSFVGQTVGGVTLTQGDRIPVAALGRLECTRTACTCAVAPCPATGAIRSAAFDVVQARMQLLYPEATADRVRIDYSGSGLGFAGDPNGMDISPIVSVRLTGHQFRPITSFLFATINLPDVRSSLTAEDSAGSQSN